ncbi:hypothetical protein ACPV5Q_20245 [Vibrio astriarenae]
MAVISRPKRQGQLDGACGFYSITNAIALLEPELEHSEIFELTLESFFKDGLPIRVVQGTGRGSIKDTLSRTINALHERYRFYDNKAKKNYIFEFKIPYWQHKERTRQDVINVLSNVNYRNGTAALIAYEYNDGDQSYVHWTVIKEFDGIYLYTHDSDGEKTAICIDEARVDALHSKNSARPYNIISSHILVLSRELI